MRQSIPSTLAFALLIGAQFLAAIVLISKRKAIYGEPEGSVIWTDPEAAAERKLPAKAAQSRGPGARPILPSPRSHHWS